MRKTHFNILVAVCVFMMTLAVAVPAAADTHYVSPGQSIQAAILVVACAIGILYQLLTLLIKEILNRVKFA